MNEPALAAFQALLWVWFAHWALLGFVTLVLVRWGHSIARKRGTWGWRAVAVLPLVAFAIHVVATVGALAEIIPALEPILLGPLERVPPSSFDLGVANLWTVVGQGAAMLLYVVSSAAMGAESRARPPTIDYSDAPPRAKRPPSRP